MNGHAFDLEMPRSLDEALDCLRRHGSESRALAGGTVLLPEIAHSRVTPSVVIDLSHAELDGIKAHPGGAVIGAMTTYRQLAVAPSTAPSSRALSWLSAVARGITGGAQIRNRGTLGGSAAYANPSSDIPAVLVALGAVLTAASAHGERELRAEELFADAFRTRLSDDELLVSIRVPEPAPGARFGYEKLKFGESSWPIATAAAVVSPSGSVRLGLGGCCAVPVALELSDAEHVADAVDSATSDSWSDVLADGAYRRGVAPVVAQRALVRAS
jgi:carbon-monoxide dehydrogenase medium subunit